MKLFCIEIVSRSYIGMYKHNEINHFILYVSTVDCQFCQNRLAGFLLTAQSDTGTLFRYTDPGGPGQDSYTVIPHPRISFPVSLVRFMTAHNTKILTLCEVFVFGGEYSQINQLEFT